MATCMFRSPLAPRLQAFLEMRVAMGRKGTNDKKMLIYLDRFLIAELKTGQPITREIVERWFKDAERLSPGTWINRISILRQFCTYLSHFDPRTCVVHRTFLPCRTRPAPYIYSQEEVRAIIAAAQKIGPEGSLRPAVIATLVGLLYCTGLRVGEALRLTLGDVDLKGQLLTIRKQSSRNHATSLTRRLPSSTSLFSCVDARTRGSPPFLRRPCSSILTDGPMDPYVSVRSSSTSCEIWAFEAQRASAVRACMTFVTPSPSTGCPSGIDREET